MFRSHWKPLPVLGAILIGWAVYSIAQDNAEDQANQPPPNEKQAPADDPEFSVECIVRVQCRDQAGEVIHEEELLGIGEDDHEAKQDAIDQCDFFDCSQYEDPLTGGLAMFCCDDNSGDPCIAPSCTETKSKDAQPSHDVRYEYSAVGNDGKPFSKAGFNDKATWERFLDISKQHDGFVPGTLKKRESPRLIHLCYVRIRWLHVNMIEETILEDVEVEGRGHSKNEAEKHAKAMRKSVIDFLKGQGDTTEVKKVGAPRFATAHAMSNRKETKACRHQCLTVDQEEVKYIITTRHDFTKQDACERAEEAAILLGDDYGGVMNCADLLIPQPAQAPAKTNAAVGCCGSRVATTK